MAAIYPADTFQEGVDLTIEASNQLAQVVRGDANTEVMVADGSTIPSIRKAQVDSMYFKEPEAWTTGQTETDYLQLKKYIAPTTGKESWWFAKGALVSNPVAMGTSPFGDDDWTLYTPEDLFISGKAEYESVYQALKGKAAEAGYNLVRGSFEEGGTLTNANDVLWYQANGKYYNWFDGSAKTLVAGSAPINIGTDWIDKSDELLINQLSSDSGASLVGGAEWVFPYVSLMKASSPNEGKKLRTISYHNQAGWAVLANPVGGANYVVMTRSDYDSLRGNTYGTTALRNGGDGANEWIDIELANGNIAVYVHDGMLIAHQAGVKGNTSDEGSPVDDSLPIAAAIAWAYSASNPLLYTYKSPTSGKTHRVHFPQGYYRADNVNLYGSVYLTGDMVGSYAGTIFIPYSTGASFFKLRVDTDGNSNAPVFEGIRFRSRSVYIAGTYVIDQPAGEFSNGANSVYFYKCWFQSAGGGDAIVKMRKGGDWRFDTCTFDGTTGTEAWIEFGDETSSTELTIHNELFNCTYYKPISAGFKMLNATGLVVSGGTLYGSGMDTFISDRANYQGYSDVVIQGLECKGSKTLAKIGRNGWNISNIRDADVQSSSYGLIYLDKSGTLTDINISGINAATTADMPLIKSNTGCTLDNVSIRGNNLRTTATAATSAAIDVSASTGVLNNFGGNISRGFAKTVNTYRPAVNGVDVYQLASSVTPGSIGAASSYTLAVTVTGAYAGDSVIISYPSTTHPIPLGIQVFGYVSAANTVTLVYRNLTSGAISVSAHDVNILIKTR